MERPIRFLLSRDDTRHTRGYWVVASILREAGVEVILGGIQIPRQIAETAVQEDADIIGYRIMHGQPRILISVLFEKMKEKGIQDRAVVVGGIIPEEDEALIRELGVKEVFHPLTPLETVVKRVKEVGEETLQRSKSVEK